jgi:hypothetical protein
MSDFSESLEAFTTKDEKADGQIVCLDYRSGFIDVVVTLEVVKVHPLARFKRSFEEAIKVIPGGSYSITAYKKGLPSQITFSAPKAEFPQALKRLVLYFSQSRLMVSPIVCCDFKYH